MRGSLAWQADQDHEVIERYRNVRRFEVGEAVVGQVVVTVPAVVVALHHLGYVLRPAAGGQTWFARFDQVSKVQVTKVRKARGARK